jgi:hypothetical protein
MTTQNLATDTIVAPTTTLGDLATILADLQREHPEAGHRVQHGAFMAIMNHVELAAGGGYWVTSERDHTTQYFVLPLYGTCTCQDHQRNGALTACKHLLACEIVRRLERLEADRDQAADVDEDVPACPLHGDEECDWGCPGPGLDPAAARYPGERDPDAPGDYWLTDDALALLGELPDLTPQCPRCHAEPALLRHPDHLGAACVSRELYGDGR